MLAEGGLLLARAGAVIAVAARGRIRPEPRRDRTPIYWVRAGAVSGLVAVAVQSLWETGLRVPANALLFALLAAIAMYEQKS